MKEGGNIQRLDYYIGYRKALMDLHIYLSGCEAAFKADRKRNNVKNVIWLLEAIIDNPDTFAKYSTETPIYFKTEGKRNVYYIKEDEWPLGKASQEEEKTSKLLENPFAQSLHVGESDKKGCSKLVSMVWEDWRQK